MIHNNALCTKITMQSNSIVLKSKSLKPRDTKGIKCKNNKLIVLHTNAVIVQIRFVVGKVTETNQFEIEFSNLY